MMKKYEDEKPIYTKIDNKYQEIRMHWYSAQETMTQVFRCRKWWEKETIADNLATRWRRIEAAMADMAELCERARSAAGTAERAESPDDKPTVRLCHRITGSECMIPRGADLPCATEPCMMWCPQARDSQWEEGEEQKPRKKTWRRSPSVLRARHRAAKEKKEER